MNKLIPTSMLFVLLFCAAVFPGTLKEMYDTALPGHGYDKVISLQTGALYEGGLYIGKTFNRITAQFDGHEGEDILIQGNGAVLDLRGGEICISYCSNRLDILDCVVINGDIRYRGMEVHPQVFKPVGSVSHVTFYGPHDHGVRIYGCGDNILAERNIFVDAVDTGVDVICWSGSPTIWLPTGSNVAFSGLGYGFPTLKDNWSFHTDAAANKDPLRHFAKICEYG